ncbi:MAG: ComF family protein [Christensenellales bacterium]
MAERLFRLLNIVDSWLFPEKITCLCCESALGDDEQDGLCPGCTQALARLGGVFQTAPPPAGIHSAFAAFPYADQPRKLILMLKFESVRAAALPLAQAMSALPLGESDALVPVPTTRRRLRQRGFNQARLLAEHLGEIWGMPVLPALSRKDEHTAQMKLSAESRRSNLADCMRSDASVSGKRILLVDDVLTTGSTASEAHRRCWLPAHAASVWLRPQKPFRNPAIRSLSRRGIFPLSCRTTRRDFSSHPRQKQASLTSA